jgi:phosphoribosyl-ATP pyrophosphohydrolase
MEGCTVADLLYHAMVLLNVQVGVGWYSSAAGG